MKNKTCGECRFFESKEHICCHSGDDAEAYFVACSEFEPKPRPTNGDVIRQGGNQALLDYRSNHKCDICIYAAPIDATPACTRPGGKSCTDGMEAWLNAPTEKEREDE